MLELVTYPDPITEVVDFLNQFGCQASSQLPDEYNKNELVTCTTTPSTMVTRDTHYTIEVRDRSGDIEASRQASWIASLLEAWARTDEGPIHCDMDSLVDSFPDPDDGCPRSILICTLTWQGTRQTI